MKIATIVGTVSSLQASIRFLAADLRRLSGDKNNWEELVKADERYSVILLHREYVSLKKQLHDFLKTEVCYVTDKEAKWL